ncbi:MAG: FAD-dependent oxidoreductase [Actinobacteria bacterium]|nr:FAD-dependent oxidoreductase [Actinomycetota bacterium]
MERTRDVIIIGAGPAGLSAGVYCARKMLDTLVVSQNVGGQATWSWEVENYLGYQLITGVELAERFREHLENFRVELREGRTVNALSRSGDAFSVATEKEGETRGRAVIVASGKVPRMLDVPGEQEYRGRGVAYCATCDAPIFRNRRVAVVGGGNSALDAALQLSGIAERVYLITNEPTLGGDEIRRGQVLDSPAVEVLYSTQITSITGDRFVNGLTYSREGEESALQVEGVFIEIGSVPSTSFLPPEVELNALGEIVVDSNNRTSVPGLFAAGDVTDVIEKQIIIAAGEGAKAALSAYAWLVEKGLVTNRA